MLVFQSHSMAKFGRGLRKLAKTKLEDRQEAQERILTKGSLETSDDRSLPFCHRQVDRFFYRLPIVQMFLQRLHVGRRNGTFSAPGRSNIRPLHNTIPSSETSLPASHNNNLSLFFTVSVILFSLLPVFHICCEFHCVHTTSVFVFSLSNRLCSDERHVLPCDAHARPVGLELF